VKVINNYFGTATTLISYILQYHHLHVLQLLSISAAYYQLMCDSLTYLLIHTIIITLNSTASFTSHFLGQSKHYFHLQVVYGCAMLYYMLDAQLFLHPQFVSQTDMWYDSFTYSKVTYMAEDYYSFTPSGLE